MQQLPAISRLTAAPRRQAAPAGEGASPERRTASALVRQSHAGDGTGVNHNELGVGVGRAGGRPRANSAYFSSRARMPKWRRGALIYAAGTSRLDCEQMEVIEDNW